MPSTSVVLAARRPRRTGVNSRERSGIERKKVSPLERGDGSEADIGGDTGTEVSGGGAGGCGPHPSRRHVGNYKSVEMPRCPEVASAVATLV
jgi:hypothetical protein